MVSSLSEDGEVGLEKDATKYNKAGTGAGQFRVSATYFENKRFLN